MGYTFVPDPPQNALAQTVVHPKAFPKRCHCNSSTYNGIVFLAFVNPKPRNRPITEHSIAPCAYTWAHPAPPRVAAPRHTTLTPFPCRLCLQAGGKIVRKTMIRQFPTVSMAISCVFNTWQNALTALSEDARPGSSTLGHLPSPLHRP